MKDYVDLVIVIENLEKNNVLRKEVDNQKIEVDSGLVEKIRI